jgi:hypothetical protein
MKNLYLSLLLSGLALLFNQKDASAQFQINDTLTVEELVDDFFNSGVLVDVTNITYNGMSADSLSPQVGLFTNAPGDSLNFETGLAMYTGFVFQLATDTSPSFGIPNYSDNDITTITGQNVNDCAVIEFDVEVNADALAFNYIFGSNEYPSFTCSSFNDGFGFFVSGPGIDGPFNNSAINIATIPDSETPVAINTINGGAPTGGGQAANCSGANPNWQNDTIYFIDNNNTGASEVNLPGITVNLEALVEVTNGETYHMKLAICDAVDGALDSGVFLEAGSFEGRFLNSTNNLYLPDLTIFPNPVEDNLRLENICETCTDKIQIVINDIRGRQVASFVKGAADQMSIPTSDLQKGIYFLSVYNNDGGVRTEKFVKE